jgi:hypothetical protein
MLKFLLILGLILYSVYKIGSLFFRAGAASQQFRGPRNPEPQVKQDKKRAFKGGEYVDYEEVK